MIFSKMHKRARPVFLILIFLLSIPVFFVNLGDTALTNWDEAWYADITRNLVKTKEVFLLFWHFKPYYDHPPLFYWLSSLSFWLGNGSELSIRFISALFGLSTVWLTYYFGRQWYNRRVGLISALVLLSSIQFLFRSRQGNIDSLLVFLFSATVFSFYNMFVKKSSAIVSGFILGLTLLTKMGIGLLAPVIVAVCLVLTGQLKKFSIQKTAMAVLVAGATIFPWYFTQWSYYGNEFISRHISVLITSRLFSALSPSMLNFWWFIPVLKSGLKLWFLFLPPAAVVTGYLSLRQRINLLPLIWLAVIFLFFSLAANKDSWHILPLYPAAALMIGIFIDNLMDRTVKNIRNKNWLTFWWMGIIIIVLFHLVVYHSQYIVPETTAAEKAVSLFVKEYSNFDDRIILDDHYFPVAVYYTQRPLIFNRLAGAGDEFATERLKEYIKSGDFNFIITNMDNLLKANIERNKVDIVFNANDKIVLKR